jgi:tetratricopeptide (TPR) repeat protein
VALQELVRLDRAGWEARGLVAWAESWAFARYIVEDPMCREVRLLQTILAALSPTAGEDRNVALSAAVFPEDKWLVLEGAWRAYVEKLPETPGEEPYRKARAALARGEARAARGLLDEAVGLDPEYERLYFFRAVAAAALGKPQAAVADLDRALALFPEYHAARFLRGQCRASAKDAAGARDDFEACLATPYRERAKKELEGLRQ